MGDEVRFPRRRADGRLAVAACFAPSDELERSAFIDFAVAWIADRVGRSGIDILADLGSRPRIESGDEGVVRVVIEARHDSQYWKDVLVYFTADAKRATAVPFAGFFDLVADEYHRASLPR